MQSLKSSGIINQPLDVFTQMALDEVVLNAARPPDLILRFYSWSSQAATFGLTQKEEDARSILISRGLAHLSLVRRPTGGGVVIHDGDVTFSLVFPWERLCAPSLIYKNIHRGVHLGLKGLGIESRLWGGPIEGRKAQTACFAGPEPMDLTDAQGRKVLGGALRRKGPPESTMGLYQGSLRSELLKTELELIRSAIISGIEIEWERPASLGIAPAWIASAQVLKAKYESAAWNQRR